MGGPGGWTARKSAAAGAADVRGAAVGAAWVSVSRRTIASFDNYADAERAMYRLADHRFPVERAAIVGLNPRIVEAVTGRLTLGIVAARSALSGAIIGALFGWLLGIFDLVDPLVSAIWLALNGLIMGGVLGAVIGLLGYAATRGRRSFTAVGSLQAERYEVLVDADVADEAVRIVHPAGTLPPERGTSTTTGHP